MGIKILVVDDDPLLCKLVTRILDTNGYESASVTNGADAIRLFRTMQPDLVLLDIAMPEMNGYDVARALRVIEQDDGRPHTPIVVLTAFARSFSPAVGDEAGVDSYLSKPITTDELLRHISRFLGKTGA